MSARTWTAAALAVLLCAVAAAAETPTASKQYKALKHAPAASRTATWAVLDRDGANRPVEKYLSSLGGGESGTGVIVSPTFKIASDEITFTVCGHDGPRGGQGKNYVALVETASGNVLQKTPAPGSDAMQERSWDTSKLRNREVRVEVHDGDPAGAYAWLGVGRIDAGAALSVDFRAGLPEGWTTQAKPAEHRPEIVRGGIPFRRYTAEYSMMPAAGDAEFPCGFQADRLFVLGCVVPEAKPLDLCGEIEIVYRQGPPERYPLKYGFTLETAGTFLSRSKAMYLHPSGDVFQHYLVLGPRPEVIEKIVLRRRPGQALPRITAVTCETGAESENLEALPDCKPSPEEAAWIESHAITSRAPDLDAIRAEIRRAHKLD